MINGWLGKFMHSDGPIDIHPGMDKADMWKVLHWAIKEIEASGRITEIRAGRFILDEHQ